MQTKIYKHITKTMFHFHQKFVPLPINMNREVNNNIYTYQANMRRVIFTILLTLITLQLSSQAPADNKNQRYFDINKNVDIFNSVVRELDLFYVDSIEVNNLIQNSIRNMLTRLDPYTEYYAEENMTDLQFMTTG